MQLLKKVNFTPEQENQGLLKLDDSLYAGDPKLLLRVLHHAFCEYRYTFLCCLLHFIFVLHAAHA